MRILIVDDHVLVREGLRLMLGRFEGVDSIVEAGSFESAEALVAQSAFDLLLVDYHLPDHDGAEVVASLARQCPDAPLVVISGDCEPTLVRGALAAGARGFIPKQSTADVMLAALEVVRRGGTYIPPEALSDSMAPLAGAFMSASQRPGSSDGLTARQRDVLELLVGGLTNKEIAVRLGTSESTIRVHVSAILRALDVENRTQACQVALQQGWFSQGGSA